MNSIYERFYGPESVADGCPACQYELKEIGPLQGPERPPAWLQGRMDYEFHQRLALRKQGRV